MVIELNKLYNCNCFDLMLSMKEKSIDFIIADLPYG